MNSTPAPILKALDGGEQVETTTGSAVLGELVDVLRERLPLIQPGDASAGYLKDLHSVLAALLLSPPGLRLK